MVSERFSGGNLDSLFSGQAVPLARPSERPVDLSIIIVHYNTLQLTLDCIRSIYEYAPHCSFEIILVDNGSDDDVETPLGQTFPNVRFLEMGSNVGFAKANNIGIANARGKFVLLLNSDTKIIEPICDRLLGELNKDSQLGMVGPLHLDGEEGFQLSCGKFPTFRSEMIRKLIHYRISIKDPSVRDYVDQIQSVTREVDWISGSCMMIRKEVMHQTGLLDESFFMYFEDVDFCARFRKKGWKIRYIPSVKLIHYGGQSVKGNLLKGLVEYRRSQLYFTRKYYGHVGSVLMRLLLFLKYNFFSLRWGVVYLREKIAKKPSKTTYVMLLLSKKVMGIVLGKRSGIPAEPTLHRAKSTVSA